MMTASSTIIPVTSTKANRLMVFSDTPVRFIISTLHKKANGMPMAVSMALRKPRVIHKTIVTRAIPRSKFPPIVFSESLISIVESFVKTT